MWIARRQAVTLVRMDRFVSFGHVGVALSAGDGAIVTYGNGTTQIGAWEHGVPRARRGDRLGAPEP